MENKDNRSWFQKKLNITPLPFNPLACVFIVVMGGGVAVKYFVELGKPESHVWFAVLWIIILVMQLIEPDFSEDKEDKE